MIEQEKTVRTLMSKIENVKDIPHVFEKNGEINIYLDNDEKHLDIQVFQNGSFEWFFRDRLKDSFGGGQDIAGINNIILNWE